MVEECDQNGNVIEERVVEIESWNVSPVKRLKGEDFVLKGDEEGTTFINC